MKIQLGPFLGTRPRAGAKLLGPNEAQIAKNCDLRSGELRPLKATSAVSGVTLIANAKVIHLFQGAYWFSWSDTNVKVARTPVKGDTAERTVWTGDSADSGLPKMGYSPFSITGTPPIRYPAAYYRLGLPKPTVAPTLALGTGGGCDIAVQQARAYVEVFVTGLGEIGQPSDPASISGVCQGQQVLLTLLNANPAGPYNITNRRIYRSVTGTNGTESRFVVELPIATTSYTDTLLDSQLGDILESSTWLTPVNTLSRVTALSGSMLAALDSTNRKDVWISEPGIYYGWPNVQAVNYDTVDIVSIGTSMAVLTKGNPYIATGTDPTALTLEKMTDEQACSSARSVAPYGDGAIYSSPDGLVLISQGGAPVITNNYLTQKEWEVYVPSSIHGYVHDKQYVGFYDTGTAQGGFIFDPRQDGGVGFTTTDVIATAGYVDVLTDALYLVVGGVLVKWQGASTYLTYQLKSGVTELDRYTNFSWGRVIASSYASLTMKVYADGVLKLTKTVTSSDPFRMPGGFLAKSWEIELSGTDFVQFAAIANSMAELRQ